MNKRKTLELLLICCKIFTKTGRTGVDKNGGVSDEEDATELRLQLDLNEQETSKLRRKVDELEQQNKTMQNQLKELRDVPKTPTLISKSTIAKDKEIAELQKKILDLDKEMKLLRKSAAKTGTQTIQKLEDDKKTLAEQVESSKSEISKCGKFVYENCEHFSYPLFFLFKCKFQTEISHKIGNLKNVIAEQEKRCMELEKTSADNDSKKKKALTDVKSNAEKLSKLENLVTRHIPGDKKRHFNNSIQQFFLIYL